MKIVMYGISIGFIYSDVFKVGQVVTSNRFDKIYIKDVMDDYDVDYTSGYVEYSVKLYY
jgi:hypothetical protein